MQSSSYIAQNEPEEQPLLLLWSNAKVHLANISPRRRGRQQQRWWWCYRFLPVIVIRLGCIQRPGLVYKLLVCCGSILREAVAIVLWLHVCAVNLNDHLFLVYVDRSGVSSGTDARNSWLASTKIRIGIQFAVPWWCCLKVHLSSLLEQWWITKRRVYE